MKQKGLTIQDSLCIKGIAIILMIFYHLYRSKTIYGEFDVNFYPFTETTATNIIRMFKICVSIFAFISGYGLLTSIKSVVIRKKEIFKWNINRLIKTMSGFWFIYIVVFIVTFLTDLLPYKVYFSRSDIAAPIYTLLDFLGLSNLFLTPTLLETWWYMSAAVIFILLIPVIYLISRKVGYLPVIAIVVILPRVLNVGDPGSLNLYSFVLPLIMGMVFAEYKIFEKISTLLEKNKVYLFLALVIAVALLVYFYFFYNSDAIKEFWELRWAVFPVIFICFSRYFIIRIPIINTILAFLGKHSMNMFLIHNIIRRYYLNEFIYSFENFIIIFLVLFILSLLMSIVIEVVKKLIRYNILIEKINKLLVKKIEKYE